MLPFLKRYRESREGIRKIPVLLEQLKAQEKCSEEQWNAQSDELHKLLARQRKSETMLEDILEALEENRITLEEQNSVKSREKALAGCINRYDEALNGTN